MEPVDVDCSWLVILYGFLSTTVAIGLHATFGIIGTELMDKRNFSQASVAWVTTISMVTRQLFSFVSMSLYRRFGSRLPIMAGGIIYGVGYTAAALSSQDTVSMYITVGVMAGMAMSLVHMTAWVAASTYYKKKRQLANGLVMSGVFGAVLFSPLVNWLLDELGLAGTFLIIAGISLNVTVIGALFPPLSEQTEIEKHGVIVNSKLSAEVPENKDSISVEHGRDGGKSRCDCSCIHRFFAFKSFRNWKYTFVVVAACLIDPVLGHTIYTYLPEFILHAGYPSGAKWLPISVLALGNVLTRLTFGFKRKTRKLLMLCYGLSGLITGVTLLSMPFAIEVYPLVCVLAAVNGIGNGFYWICKGPVLAEILPRHEFENGVGTCEVCTGFVMLLCPLQGEMFDLTGEYTNTFVVPGVMSAFAGCLLLTLPFTA